MRQDEPWRINTKALSDARFLSRIFATDQELEVANRIASVDPRLEYRLPSDSEYKLKIVEGINLTRGANQTAVHSAFRWLHTCSDALRWPSVAGAVGQTRPTGPQQ